MSDAEFAKFAKWCEALAAGMKIAPSASDLTPDPNAVWPNKGDTLMRRAARAELYVQKLRTVLEETMRYADLVGSKTDTVHQAVIARCQQVLAETAK